MFLEQGAKELTEMDRKGSNDERKAEVRSQKPEARIIGGSPLNRFSFILNSDS